MIRLVIRYSTCMQCNDSSTVTFKAVVPAPAPGYEHCQHRHALLRYITLRLMCQMRGEGQPRDCALEGTRLPIIESEPGPSSSECDDSTGRCCGARSLPGLVIGRCFLNGPKWGQLQFKLVPSTYRYRERDTCSTLNRPKRRSTFPSTITVLGTLNRQKRRSTSPSTIIILGTLN